MVFLYRCICGICGQDRVEKTSNTTTLRSLLIVRLFLRLKDKTKAHLTVALVSSFLHLNFRWSLLDLHHNTLSTHIHPDSTFAHNSNKSLEFRDVLSINYQNPHRRLIALTVDDVVLGLGEKREYFTVDGSTIEIMDVKCVDFLDKNI